MVYREARRRIERLWGFVPLRVPGLVLLLSAVVVALRVGRAQADHLLYPAGLAAAGLVVACAACAGIAALLLRRAVRRLPSGVPDSLETTVATRTEFRFPRFAGWPLVEVRMVWEEPAGIDVQLEPAGRWLHEVVVPRERGRHARIVRRFMVEDIFGLASVSFRVVWGEQLRIAPAAAAGVADLTTSYSHGDAFSHPSGRQEGDLVEMRSYGYGDPLRHVLWKTFARTRRLLVRMPERAIAPQPVTVAFMVAGAGDEPTAATARVYLEKGAFGPDFLFSADGATRPTRNVHEALDQIIDSVRARGDGGAALDGLASQIEQSRLAACVVFAPPTDGPWRERVASFCRRYASAATVVIGVDGQTETKPRGQLARLLYRAPQVEEDRALAALPALRAALEADGLRVQVLHRNTGQLL